jgi:hypothetical protein
MLFRQSALLALALLPFSLAQISNDFESGWDQTTWPIYAPDCNTVRLFSYEDVDSYTIATELRAVSRLTLQF